MLKKLTPLIFIAAALGLFFGFIDPQYKLAASSDVMVARFNDTTTRLNSLISERDSKIKKEKDIGDADNARLKKLLPDTVDNVRLVLDLDSMARKYQMNLRNIKFSNSGGDAQGTASVGQGFGMINLSFSVNSSYENFKKFLIDLEDSLRIVDVTSLKVNANNPGIYEFSMALQTYWLK